MAIEIHIGKFGHTSQVLVDGQPIYPSRVTIRMQAGMRTVIEGEFPQFGSGPMTVHAEAAGSIWVIDGVPYSLVPVEAMVTALMGQPGDVDSERTSLEDWAKAVDELVQGERRPQ